MNVVEPEVIKKVESMESAIGTRQEKMKNVGFVGSEKVGRGLNLKGFSIYDEGTT